MLGVPFAPAWFLVRSMWACLTTLIKQSCGIERHRVKNRDYIRGQDDVKAKTVFFSVQPLGPVCLCGVKVCPNHGDTEYTEVAQRRSSDPQNLLIFTEIWRFVGPSETKKL